MCSLKPQTSAPLHSGRVFGTLRGIVVQRLQRKLGEKFCVRKSAAGIRFQYRFANYVWATRKAKAEEQAVRACVCVWGLCSQRHRWYTNAHVQIHIIADQEPAMELWCVWFLCPLGVESGKAGESGKRRRSGIVANQELRSEPGNQSNACFWFNEFLASNRQKGGCGWT